MAASQTGTVAATGSPASAPEPESPLIVVGAQALQFTGKVRNSAESGLTEVSLSSLTSETPSGNKSKVVLLSFFEASCPPCTKELPLLQQLHKEFGSRGLRVVSVGFDEEGPAWDTIDGLIKTNHLTYPVVRDVYQFIAMRYLGHHPKVPSVFIIGEDRRVKLVKQGYSEDASKFLRAEVVKALKL
jgi:peroxiredoxin